jgi:predicted SnoaL-like aldol condensation-catalyzing enzyme
MTRTKESHNKALVLEAFDTLFNKRDYVAVERYWSPDYIQHSAHIEPGRDGLFTLIKNVPSTLKYEPGVIVAEGDFVIVHGRFSGHGRPKTWIAGKSFRIMAIDIQTIRDGKIARTYRLENWLSALGQLRAK